MKQLGTLEKQLSSASLYKRRDNSPKNSLSEMLSTPKQAKYFIGLLRHGSTQANMQDARAESNIPLLDFEFGSQSTIRVQARNLLKLGINVDDLCIHFDNKVVRDWQTAKVFCEELGLVFPTEDEMMDEKSMQKYPYLMVTGLIATRAKGDEKNMEITLMGDPNNIGAESTEDARRRITRYVQKLSSDIYSHKNNFSHHILIGHRTGTNGFIDAKFHRETIRLIQDIQESGISQLDYGLLNSSGEFINLADSWVQYGKAGGKIKHHNADVFEFSLQNYQQQVQDLKTDIPKLSILSGNDLINDTNIVNAYLASIKKDITEKDAPEQVAYYLKNKSEVVCDYVLTFAVAIIASQKYQQKELEGIVINHLKTHDISENKRCLLFEKLYHSKHEFWRCLFRLMYEKNKGIVGNSTMSKIIEEERTKIGLSSDGRLISKTNIEQEIEKIESIRKYEDIHIDTLLGNNIALKDFYVPQNLSVEEKNISADDLVNYILQSNKNIFAIQAAGGSGKTILSKYLLMNLSNSSVLQKNNAYSTRVKEIDLNKYTPDNIESILQGPESIFIIDALDEKKSDIVKKLTEISNSDTFKHSGKKLVILGRYIEDRFLYENESKKESIEAFQLQQEVTIVEYIQSFTKIIQPQHIQEKFEKELSDIVKILDKELHTPIIIEMLAKIVKKKLISGRNRKIFDDENNITRKVIYDKFFEYLHEREEQKSDSLGENSERLYINNSFMGEEYDQLRKDFLIYLSILEEGYGNPSGQLEIRDNDFQDIFKKFILEENNNGQKELIKDFVVDIKNIELFKESLLSIGVLKTDQNGKLSFHHKTFEEYFGYLFYLSMTEEQWYQYVQLIVDKGVHLNRGFMKIPYFNNPIKSVEHIKEYQKRGLLEKLVDRGLMDDILVPLKRIKNEYTMAQATILRHKGENELFVYDNDEKKLYNKFEVYKNIIEPIQSLPVADKNGRFVRSDGVVFGILDTISSNNDIRAKIRKGVEYIMGRNFQGKIMQLYNISEARKLLPLVKETRDFLKKEGYFLQKDIERKFGIGDKIIQKYKDNLFDKKDVGGYIFYSLKEIKKVFLDERIKEKDLKKDPDKASISAIIKKYKIGIARFREIVRSQNVSSIRIKMPDRETLYYSFKEFDSSYQRYSQKKNQLTDLHSNLAA